jgi:hypothetical protein
LDQAMDWPKLLPRPDAEGSPGFTVEVGSVGAGAGQARVCVGVCRVLLAIIGC